MGDEGKVGAIDRTCDISGGNEKVIQNFGETILRKEKLFRQQCRWEFDIKMDHG
jgi:hypothetical protein